MFVAYDKWMNELNNSLKYLGNQTSCNSNSWTLLNSTNWSQLHLYSDSINNLIEIKYSHINFFRLPFRLSPIHDFSLYFKQWIKKKILAAKKINKIPISTFSPCIFFLIGLLVVSQSLFSLGLWTFSAHLLETCLLVGSPWNSRVSLDPSQEPIIHRQM